MIWCGQILSVGRSQASGNLTELQVTAESTERDTALPPVGPSEYTVPGFAESTRTSFPKVATPTCCSTCVHVAPASELLRTPPGAPLVTSPTPASAHA